MILRNEGEIFPRSDNDIDGLWRVLLVNSALTGAMLHSNEGSAEGCRGAPARWR